MRIVKKLALLFSIIILFTISVTSFFIFQIFEEHLIEIKIQDMEKVLDDKEIQIQNTYAKSLGAYIFSTQNPNFVKCFELNEDYEVQVVQFTVESGDIGEKLETWTSNFEKQFSMDQNCLVEVTYSSTYLNEIDPEIQKHFTIPPKIVKDILFIDLGKMFIFDDQTSMISNSDQKLPPNLMSQLSKYDFRNNELENFIITTENQIYHVKSKQIQTLDWTLVYVLPESQILADDKTLSTLTQTIIAVSSLLITFGLILIYIISSRISKPIITLSDECHNQVPHNLKPVSEVTGDEIGEVSVAINSMIEQVNQLKKQKDEFIAMLTHELKTPLIPIFNWCENLQHEKMQSNLTPKQKNAIVVINECAHRLEKLITDMLNAHKLDLEQLPIHPHEFDMKQLMDAIHRHWSNVMKSKNIEFHCHSPHTIKMFSDDRRIEQIFATFITNSIDFVPENDAKIEIGCTEHDDKNIICYVKDNGIGIAKEVQANLFKKFYQADSSSRRKHGGTGLGLAVAKGIIELLEGTIEIHSDKGKGAELKFILPKRIKDRKKEEKK